MAIILSISSRDTRIVASDQIYVYVLHNVEKTMVWSWDSQIAIDYIVVNQVKAVQEKHGPRYKSVDLPVGIQPDG